MKKTHRWLIEHPARVTLAVLPAAIAAQVAIDVALGERAEYYNAASFLQAVGRAVTGEPFETSPAFLLGQAQLGMWPSLAMGAGLLVLVPLAVVALIVFPIHWQLKRRDPTWK